MYDKASECIMSIMTVSVLVYKRFATLYVYMVMQMKLVAVVAVFVIWTSMYLKQCYLSFKLDH